MPIAPLYWQAATISSPSSMRPVAGKRNRSGRRNAAATAIGMPEQADRISSTRERSLAVARRTTHILRMTVFLTILLVLAMLGTLTVLGFGVASLLRGGDPRRSNKLMQSRVIMQALALVLLAMLMLLARH